MDAALLMRFAPLAKLAKRPAGDLSVDDLTAFAQALAPDSAAELSKGLRNLAEQNPGVPALELLGTPAAMKALEHVRQVQDEDNMIADRCPHCNCSFLRPVDS